MWGGRDGPLPPGLWLADGVGNQPVQPWAESSGLGAVTAARGGGVGVEEEEGAGAEGGLPLEDGLAVEEMVGDVEKVLEVDCAGVRLRRPCTRVPEQRAGEGKFVVGGKYESSPLKEVTERARGTT